MKILAAVLRLALGLLALIAVLSTFIDTASRVAINPFNFFGYFTLQSNILGAVVFMVVGLMSLLGRRIGYPLHVIRGIWVTYLIIVGLVYNLLLVGTPGGGGVALPWANAVLHIVFPLYALLDWLIFADRPRLRWKHLGFVAIYPAVWAVVVLIRGATDGWVPYPFLDPALGYGSVAVTLIVIALAVVLFGAGVWAASRLRLLVVGETDVAASGS